MAVNKFTSAPSQLDVINKINEIIDNLGGGSATFMPNYSSGTSITSSQKRTPTQNELLVWFKTNGANTANVYLGSSTSGTKLIGSIVSSSYSTSVLTSFTIPLVKDETYYIELSGGTYTCKVFPLTK